MAHDDRAGSMQEPQAQTMWLALFRKAVATLADAQDGADFVALFAGNTFDMTIAFKRHAKGSLRSHDRAEAS